MKDFLKKIFPTFLLSSSDKLLPSDELDLIYNLNQVLLSSENYDLLYSELLQNILKLLNFSKENCHFVSAVFFDNAGIKQVEYVDISGFKPDAAFFSKLLKEYQGTTNTNSNIVLLNNLENIDNLLNHNVKTVVFVLIKLGTGINLLFSLGCESLVKSISEDDKKDLLLTAQVIGFSFKLQNNQKSLTDITQQVYQMNSKLHNLDHLKDDFVSVASHELRTPMTAIRSYVWMALHKPDVPLTEKLKKYLYRTLVSTERLINLVNDMLNVSRIEAGKIEIDPKPFDIVVLVKEVMEEVKVKADEKLIKLQVLEQKLPSVFADPDKVHQILLNLVGNALKFTPPDGVISVGFFTDGNMIEISVKDTGAGISKEDLAKLFHKFSRLDNSYVAMGVSGGTGLGLYISKSLVDLMRGRIWASSEGLNKGTTFAFSLPIATKELISEPEKFHIKPQGEIKTLEPVTI